MGTKSVIVDDPNVCSDITSASSTGVLQGAVARPASQAANGWAAMRGIVRPSMNGWGVVVPSVSNVFGAVHPWKGSVRANGRFDPFAKVGTNRPKAFGAVGANVFRP